MNTKNDTFSLSRFWKLLKYDFNNNRLYYIAIIPVAMLAIGIFMYSSFPDTSLLEYKAVENQLSMDSDFGYASNWSGYNYPFSLIIGYVIFVILIVGNSFPWKKDQNAVIKHLLIPSSNFEKFLVQWFFRIFLFLLLFPIIFKISTNFAIDIYLNQKEALFKELNIPFTYFPTVEKLNYSTLYKHGYIGLEKLLVFLTFYLTGPSLLFLLATFYKKWIPVLGSLSILFLMGLAYFYLVIISNILVPKQSKFWSINIDISSPHFFDGEISLFTLSIVFIGIVMSKVSWITAYFRLKELEV